MIYKLKELTFETTRKCNQHCEHCMRGNSQDINLTKEIVDFFFYRNEIKSIETLCFSGGEPTLNPDIIIYIINKIIDENIDVDTILMVTNGQVYNDSIIKVFNKFNEYKNKKLLLENKKERSDNVVIIFSTDQYHKKIKEATKNKYKENAKGLQINESGLLEKLIKTGLSKYGDNFIYTSPTPKYDYENDVYNILDGLYITSTGNITTEGDGMYEDMDNNNLGNLKEKNLEDILKYQAKIKKKVIKNDLL